MDSKLEITRTLKDNSFLVVYEKGLMKDYEKRVLAGREVENLLKMRFITSEKHDNVYYEISSYTPLDQVVFNDLYEAMDIIEGILTVMIKTEDYLIDVGNICLDYPWIYYDTVKRSVHLAYLPRRQTLQWQTSFHRLLVDLQEMCDSKEAQPYFESLKDYIGHCQRSLQDVFLKVCDLQRETHLSIGPM